jgi:hypothetical protein
MANIRESNRVFFSTVVAQAQKVEVEGDSLVFVFAPVHKSMRNQLDTRREWLEKMAAQIAGRPIRITSKEGEAAAAPQKDPAAIDRAAKQADLKARAKAEPSVQNILDVFGGEIEDVEEIK